MIRTVGILVFPDVTLLDVTGPAEVFGRAVDPATGDPAYRVVLVSVDGGPVTAHGGLGFANTVPADQIDRLDTLLVAGGDSLPHGPLDPALLRATSILAEGAARIGSVCTGAFVLAELGLLDGRKATTHWREASLLARRHPSVTVEPDVLHTRDQNLYTSAGISAGIDLALAMVEDDLGPATARDIARDIVVYMHRPGGQSQFSAALETPIPQTSALRTVMDAVLADPAARLSMADMARMAHLSERHLRRLFLEEVGTTPTSWLERVRLDRARQLLLDGQGVTAAAELSGFGSDEQLRRAFARHLDTTPSEYRQRFSTANQT